MLLLLLFACFGVDLKETEFSLQTSTYKSTFHSRHVWWFLTRVEWGDEQLKEKQAPRREQGVLWIRRSGLSRQCGRQGFVQETCEEKPDLL